MNKKEITDKGVIKTSTINAYLPSPFAVGNLFFLHFSGEFICNKDYNIHRQYLDMFLIMHVKQGRMSIDYEGNTFYANKGDLVIFDCKKEHEYRAETDNTVFQWFHFSGNASQAYYDKIKNLSGIIISDVNESIVNNIDTVVNEVKTPLLDEHRISVLVHTILGSLVSEPIKLNIPSDSYLYRVIKFIDKHFSEEISISDMADAVSLSPHYFIKWFKKHMSYTPHEYLTNVRIKEAKERLLNTDNSIESIALECGFNSASHFARRFKATVGMTPGSFRDLPF